MKQLMLNSRINNQSGAVLIVVFLVMLTIFLLISYFLNFIITETKIASSHELASQTYYLTEAGIQEAVWKIKNDQGWADNFQNNASWQTTFTRTNPFDSNQSYTINLQNTDVGNAQVNVSGHYLYGGKIAQRLVKTIIFQPQGAPPPPPPPPAPPPLPSVPKNVAIFANTNVNFSGSVVDVASQGGIFTNGTINLSNYSRISLADTAAAVNQINIPWGSSLQASALRANNYPPAPNSQNMPAIDFNSTNQSSYKKSANYTYSTSQFNQLFGSSSNVTLTGIVYVTGSALIPRGYTLTINGALVAEGNIIIGTEWWPNSKSKPSLIINDPGEGPAGLISKRKIIFSSQASIIQINGLIYALDEFKMEWDSPKLTLTGGIIAKKINVSNNQISISYNANAVARGLAGGILPTPPPPTTTYTPPTINIENWEEEY